MGIGVGAGVGVGVGVGGGVGVGAGGGVGAGVGVGVGGGVGVMVPPAGKETFRRLRAEVDSICSPKLTLPPAGMVLFQDSFVKR